MVGRALLLRKLQVALAAGAFRIRRCGLSAGGGTPACADDAGVFQAKSIGRNTCTASQYTLSLGYRDKRMFADLAFSPDVPRSASNQQKVRVNAGALW